MAVFHAAVGGAAWWLGARWPRRLAGRRRPGWLWGFQVAADATLLAWAAGLAGLFTAVLAPHPAFTLARFLCQALFLEAPLLAGWIAFVHARAGERRRAAVPAVAALVLVAAYADAYHVEPRRLEVRRHVVTLGEGGRTLRIGHLSDLQTHRIGEHERRAFQALADLKPDLVAYTGDYLQARLGGDLTGPTEDFRRLLREAAPRAPLGAYAVPGDVEGDGWRSLFAGAEVVCLEDAATHRDLPGGGRLAVVGLTNATSRGREPEAVAAALGRAPDAELTLLLGHRPDCVRAVPPGAADLVLAGHTHGGQVVLPFLGPPVTLSRLPRRVAAGGLHRVDGTWLHVSRGVGMERLTAPQVRFLCPPEVSLIEVRF